MSIESKSTKAVAKRPRSVKPAVASTRESVEMNESPVAASGETPAETVVQTPEPVSVSAPEPQPAVAPIPASAGHEDVKPRYNITMEQAMKSITDVNEFAKGNFEALIASAKAATAGAETLTAAAVEQSKKNFEDAQEAFKALTAAKTPNEALQLQTDYAKAQFEKGVAAWSQWSETVLKVSGEVFQPLSSRLAVASETVRKNVAA